MSNKITVIIVEYNTPDRTARYICDLSRVSDCQDLSFVVVDNYCERDNESRLWNSLHAYTESSEDKTDIRAISYIHAPSNLGFARGNNLGVKKANEQYDPKYYLFSNSDIELPDPLELSRLTEVLETHPEVAVTGPRITGPDGITQSPSVRVGIVGKHIVSNLLWPVNLFIPSIRRFNRNVIDDPATGPAYYVVGAFMLVRRDAFEAVGGFDEHTFLYAEEGILAERLRRIGLGEYYVNEVSILHEEGGSTGSTRSRDQQALKNLLRKRKRVFRSEMYYYKHYRKTPDLLISFAWFSFTCFCLKLRLYMLLRKLI